VTFMGTRNLIEIINKESKQVFKKGLSERLICSIVDSAIHSRDYEFSSEYEGLTLIKYSDFNRLNTKVLAQILEGLAASDPKQITNNKKQFYDKVASPDLIVSDHNFTSTHLMDGYQGMNKQDFDLMATIGHAQNGHGSFRGHGKFTNTNFDNVMTALRNNSKKFSNDELFLFPYRCQKDIDEWAHAMVFSFFEGDNYRNSKKRLLDAEGQPLGRLNFLNGFEAYPLSLLAGWVFTGFMDTEEIRDEVEIKYGHSMGRGETFAVDRGRLAHLGIGLYDLAKKEYNIEFLNHLDSKRLIKLFRETGIIVSKPVEDAELHPTMTWDEAKQTFGIDTTIANGDIIEAYIRSVKGWGVADDIAVFLSAYLTPSFKNFFALKGGVFVPYYNNSPNELMSQLLGGAGADRADTKEKYAYLVVEGGQDNLSARLAQVKFKELCKDPCFRGMYDIPARKDGEYEILDRDTMVDYTFASAKLKNDIHSSARYFLKGHQIDEKIEGKVNKGVLTCTTNEIFRLAADIAEYLHIPCESLYQGNGDVPCDMTVGFHKIPLETVLEEMTERLGVVIDPVKRQYRLNKMAAEFRAEKNKNRN